MDIPEGPFALSNDTVYLTAGETAACIGDRGEGPEAILMLELRGRKHGDPTNKEETFTFVMTHHDAHTFLNQFKDQIVLHCLDTMAHHILEDLMGGDDESLPDSGWPDPNSN